MESDKNSAADQEELGQEVAISSTAKTPPTSEVALPTESAAPATGSFLRLHLILAAGLTLCVGAFCVEIIRALDGNTLSWLYVFEWPFFGGFGIYMWWKLLHEADRAATPSDAGTNRPGDPPAPSAKEPDEALTAWKRYLLEMREAEHHDRDGAT